MGLFLVQMLSFFIFLYFSAVNLRCNVTDLNLVNEAYSSSCWHSPTHVQRGLVLEPSGTQGLDNAATWSLKDRSKATVLPLWHDLPKLERINDSSRWLDLTMALQGWQMWCCTHSTLKLAADVLKVTLLWQKCNIFSLKCWLTCCLHMTI